VQDVIPFTLGVLVADGAMEPLIKKDTTVPCFHEQIFTTYHDD
jgi:molecular chaperone DnaK (HSP70)